MNSELHDKGYVLLKNFLAPQRCRHICDFLWKMKDRFEVNQDDAQVENTIASIPFFPPLEKLMESRAELLSGHAGRSLVPSLSLTRIYQPGNVLARHVDREACEYTVTLHLGHRGAEPWPIWLKDLHGEEVACVQEAGDALLLLGHKIEHWRDRFEGETGDWWAQTFLFYVDRDGPFADWKYDKRHALGHRDYRASQP